MDGRVSDVHADAMTRYADAKSADSENREKALDDLLFYAGEQWPDAIKRQRDQSNRPVLTVNQLPKFVRQVTGEIRQNKPGIKVRPAGPGADADMAEIKTGLIRHIEQQSNAGSIYVTAVESAARCGMGHFRIVTQYSSDDAFDQDIRLARISDPFSVVWDPSAREPTREDAEYCFHRVWIPLDEFKRRYPKASTSSWEDAQPVGQQGDSLAMDWWDRESEQVAVAEYWIKKRVKHKLLLLATGAVLSPEDYDAERDGPVTREREVFATKVCRYTLSGAEQLGDEETWLTRYIPIIPVVGEEVHVGDRVSRFGMVRFAKQPQQLYNYFRSAAAELIGLAPKVPFILDARSIQGFEAEWKDANIAPKPYLRYHARPDVPPPSRSPTPEAPAALWQEAELASNDLYGTTGIYPPSLGQRSNETSGKAILARQREGDVGSFLYVDNLAIAIQYAGRQLLELIPKVYDATRVIRVLGEDDSEKIVTVNEAVNDANGAVEMLNDMSAGEYDVVVTVGPAYTTKRLEAAESMMQFVQAVPQAAAVVSDLIAKNMDWPGAEEISDRLRKTLPPGIVEPKEGEEQPAPPPPDPRAIAEVKKAEADAAKVEAQVQGQQLDNAMKQLDIAALTGQIQDVVRDSVLQTLMQIMAEARGQTPMMPTGGQQPGFPSAN